MNTDTESTAVAVQKGVLDPVICTEMQGHDTIVAVEKGVLDQVICTEMQGHEQGHRKRHCGSAIGCPRDART